MHWGLVHCSPDATLREVALTVADGALRLEPRLELRLVEAEAAWAALLPACWAHPREAE